MKRAIIAILFCLLILSLGCAKVGTFEPAPDTTPDAEPDTIGEQPSDVAEIEEGLSDADAIEEELTVGEELDEDFLENLDW